MIEPKDLINGVAGTITILVLLMLLLLAVAGVKWAFGLLI